MRIAFFTSEFEFGEKSLPALIEQGENIIGVVIPLESDENRRAQNIRRIAIEKGIPVFQWKTFKDPNILYQIREWDADLGVSAGNMQYIFRRDVLDSFKFGVINYHSSLLPKNGGQFPIHWQIYKGEDKIGITIHYCDEGIDTGDIILQESVPLGEDDTFKTIYFGQVLQKSVNLLSKAVRLIREGRAPRIPQDLSQSTYNPPFGENEATIKWDDDVQKIYNAIRACDAWPGARTKYRGLILKIWRAKRITIESSNIQPGTIVDIIDKGIVVAASNGAILVERVQLGNTPKSEIGDFLKSQNIKVGEKLG
jgi:methionyl-tRNA formyltransferase